MPSPATRSFFYHSRGFRTGLYVTATIWDEQFQVVNSAPIVAMELGDGVYGLILPLVSGKNGVLIKENSIPSLLIVLIRH